MNFSFQLGYLARHYPVKKGRNRIKSFASRNVKGFAIIVDDFDNKLLLDLRNVIDVTVLLEGSYEKECIQILWDWVSDLNEFIFLDIGAYCGYFSLALSRHKACKQAHAFEPDPENYARLMANVYLNNKLQKVKTHNMALSSVNGSAEFYLATNAIEDDGKLNTGTGSLIFQDGRHQASDIMTVTTCRGDEVINYRDQNLAIKIDVEGHELAALKGLERTLRDNNCFLLVELWDHQPDNISLVNEFLAGLDYEEKQFSLPPHASDNHIFARKL